MNTVQEEEEIKYIPEGAKCKSHAGIYGLHYPFTGAQDKIRYRFCTYLGFRKQFPTRKTYPSYSLGQRLVKKTQTSTITMSLCVELVQERKSNSPTYPPIP